MQLKGIHHVSALTGVAKDNYDFYTNTMGMRLVKKTVNQDDTSIYHLFFADAEGNPGTDLTFFEIPMAGTTYTGNNSISNTALRVPTDASIEFWKQRFEKLGVEFDEPLIQAGRLALPFRDPEGQRLTLVSDEHNEGVPGGKPWKHAEIPQEHGIIGLGPVKITVPQVDASTTVLTELMGFSEIDGYSSNGHPIRVFETGDGGSGAEVHVEARTDLSPERPGKGSVHHVAYRVEDMEELKAWHEKLKDARIPNSGIVERYYFTSLYFREPNGILYELATDGPGFDTDEPMDKLGESLALPPFLEPQRSQIEARLKPLDTNKSN
ncbi:ring-cleaving dioxygenase [Thalassobacillus hwangdonensis]|uniref:Ring-cleaving dioxygenase n=1 Tax=Thalassobacillus hwangdonensis TaxID=546108 RepID=A0ABW3L3H9_9BACI